MIFKDNCIKAMKEVTPPLLPYAYSIREMRVSRDKDMPLVRGST